MAIALSATYTHVAYAAGPDAGPCSSPNKSQNFAGVEKADANQKHGVAGTIQGQDLHMCTSPTLFELSSSFAWVALGDGGSSGDVIIQLGIGKCRDGSNTSCGDAMRIFYAWGYDQSAPGCQGSSSHRVPYPIFLSGYNGAAHNYKIYHQSNQYRFFVDATQKTFVAESNVCWTPTRAWWFSETWDNGDALGGSVGDPLSTTLTNYANAENGGFFWTSLAGSCRFNPAAPYHCVVTTGTSFNVWTER